MTGLRCTPISAETHGHQHPLATNPLYHTFKSHAHRLIPPQLHLAIHRSLLHRLHPCDSWCCVLLTILSPCTFHTAFTPAQSLWFHHFQKSQELLKNRGNPRVCEEEEDIVSPCWFSPLGEWGVQGSGLEHHSWAPLGSVHLCQLLCSQQPSEQQSGEKV